MGWDAWRSGMLLLRKRTGVEDVTGSWDGFFVTVAAEM